MKRASTLLVVAFVSTASLASGENRPVPILPGSGDYDFSGKSLLSNPTLQTTITNTLIKGAKCRSLASVGYGNGYQCPPTGMNACMTMLKAGQVDACAQLGARDYMSTCASDDAAAAKNVDPPPASTCADLTQNLWSTLAINIPYPYAKRRLEAFGCTADTGTVMKCPPHIREWLCQPFERGGVVTCPVQKVSTPPPSRIQ